MAHLLSKDVSLLTKEKHGVGKPAQEGDNPWECTIYRGELVVEIPEKDRLPNQQDKHPDNYRLYSDPDITLYAAPLEVTPLSRDELKYLIAVQPPSVRIQQFLNEKKLKEIMEIKKGDMVMFKFKIEQRLPDSIIRGKVQYIGHLDEKDGIYFGIEIINKEQRSRGTTNGRPHFNCGDNNAVYVAMDRIVQKCAYHGDKPHDHPLKDPITKQPSSDNLSKRKDISSPTNNTRSRSEAMTEEKKEGSSGSWAKGMVDKLAQKFGRSSPMIECESEEVPPPEGYLFKKGDRVVLQSVRNKNITGTVKWVGQVKTSKEVGSIPIKAVGVETDVKIKPDKDFPDLHLCVTGSHGHDLFRVAPNHDRIYLPEQLVVHAKDYTQQQQIDNQQDVKIAKDYGLSVEEYRAQKEMLDQANRAQDIEHEKRIDIMVPDPEIKGEYENEEQSVAGIGAKGGGQHTREVEESFYLVQTGQPVDPERIEQERQALEEFQRAQHEDFQHSGNGPSADRRQTSQGPSSIPVYQNMSNVISGKTNLSPNIAAKFSNIPDTEEKLVSSIGPSQNSSYSSLPSQPPIQNPSQFAIGSMVYIPTQHGDPLCGVVMWIGTVPEIDGLVAGVELDNPLVGCTDGTWQGRRLFNCPPERAFFCPIAALRLDTRYIDPGQIPAGAREDFQNPLKKLAPQFEEEDTFVTTDLFTKYIGDEHGIQGHHNSCYLDATVFGLFALSDSFDMMLLEEPNDHVGQKIKYILWKGIVNPLRKYGLARHESVMELRNSLEEFGQMNGANKDEKDLEFLNLLFKEILHVKPFLSIKRSFGVEKEYFIQLFFEIDPQQNELPETEKLIAQMFHEQKISFTNVPSKLLLQMPHFGKDFKMYNRIIPSLTINVKPLLDPSARGIQKCYLCLSNTATTICYNCSKDLYHIDEPYVFYCSNCCENAHKSRKDHHCEDVELKQDNIGDVSQISQMQLLSVICIETSHYVCYTRSQNRWLFHDSMANRLYDMYYIPRVVDVTEDLQDWVYNPDNRQKLKDSPAKSIPEYVHRFTQDIYMCVYVNPELDLYGEATDPMESLQGGEHFQYGGWYKGTLKQGQHPGANMYRRAVHSGPILREVEVGAPTTSQSNVTTSTDSNSIPQVVSLTMNDLQDLLEEKTKVCEKEVPFDEVITMMEKVIIKQQEQNSAVQQENKWLSTTFDRVSSAYKELWELFDNEKEKNLQLQTEMNQLQDEHYQLEETHQEHLLDHFQLQLTHDQQEEEYYLLQEVHQQQLVDHQKLQQEASQQEEQLSQLQKTHQNKVEEYSQLQQTYQQQLEDHQQLQQTLEQVQKQVEKSIGEKVLLQKKITTIEGSWKVSFKELAFTKEEVGRGAWGAVRVAIFREQRVAVKQMHELLINKDTREATLQLLNREINTMAQLRHPNLLQFIGAVLDDPSGNPMIITEIMDTSLRNAYETKQLIPHPSCEPVMLTIIRDVAVGLNYLHCLPDPIIHRDVSSSNVLLESKGPHKWKTKISDFGSANKARQAMTRAAGAYVYSAPESLRSVVSAKKAQTTKMDVFSYGVLFCEIMTCRFPDEDVFQEMLQQVRSRSPSLYDLIFSCIKEDPSSRPIMKQIIERLDSYIKQRPK